MIVLDLYLIATRRDRYVLFSPPDSIEVCEADSGDRVRQFVAWVARRRNRLVAWVGRVMGSGHSYYERLEDRIDPAERVLKAIACTDRLVVRFAPRQSGDAVRSQFKQVLKRQRWKHTFWLCVNGLVCLVVIGFTPVLVPVPGPNVFFYYPFLRWLSHYRALRGTIRGLRAEIEFQGLPGLNGLEENMHRRPDHNMIRQILERLQIRGLERFLERMA